tara:strand:- start:409 stop:810 length:402 start_codon:yes stop_codon:yes gene_type:complete
MRRTWFLAMAALSIAIGLSGCGRKTEAIGKVQNRLKDHESQYVMALKTSINDDQVVKACKRFESQIELLESELKDCPEDYQAAVRDLLRNVREITQAAENDNLDLFKQLNEERLKIALRINKTAEENGLTIER